MRLAVVATMNAAKGLSRRFSGNREDRPQRGRIHRQLSGPSSIAVAKPAPRPLFRRLAVERYEIA
jgi:hypothetical protein